MRMMNSYTADLNKAEGILSDPGFDVENFVKTITYYYKNKDIIHALGSDANIVLGLIQSGNYQLFEMCPNFINPDIFEKYKDMQFEVWHRKKVEQNRADSHWYGVVFSNDLACFYRRIGNTWSSSNEFEVISGPDVAKSARDRWKKVKMYPIGVAAKAPPPVYKIRSEIWDLAEKHLKMNARWRSQPHQSDFRWYNYNGSYNKAQVFNFQVFQSGETLVRVEVVGPKDSILYTDKICVDKRPVNPRNVWKTVKKFNINEPHLWFRIIEWAAGASTANQEYATKHINSWMAEYKKQNGLV